MKEEDSGKTIIISPFVDSDGLKQGVEKELYKGFIIRETPYVNGKKHGKEIHYEYFIDDYGVGDTQKIGYTTYVNGLREGLEEIDNRRTQYSKDVKHGIETIKFKDGGYVKTPYINGVKHGIEEVLESNYLTSYERNSILTKTPYTNGVVSGKEERYQRQDNGEFLLIEEPSHTEQQEITTSPHVKERKYELDYDDKIGISFESCLFDINKCTYGTTTLYRVVYADGTKGGYIENESNLSQEGNCRVLDNARVYGFGVVKDNAIVRGSSKVHGNSVVGGSAILIDKVEVMNYSEVNDYSVLSGNTSIDEECVITGKAKIHNSSLDYCDIKDDCSISSSKISGVITNGKTEIKDGVKIDAATNIKIANSTIAGSVLIKAGIEDRPEIFNSTISDSAKLYGSFSIDNSSLSGSTKIDGRDLSSRLIVSNSSLSYGTYNTNVVDLKQPQKQGFLSCLVKPFQPNKKKGLGF